ncbi:hypothetical protein HDA32_002616 [Spinactinospora alkalitolerans]|uniref:Uncharacterized protein n=1 Tax=Spinactinospora alkalitolerans TaxID=687207 RepID=A0A852TSU2_9ACTN|nr:hypothetical protein [Spinactinospora alkalitolerans]NYE47496.1 hypothetical protein [Spinactinospora alkalitolerans]
MRSVHGGLLLSGIPRITRPRKRKNTGNTSGFTVVDPGGNWIRIFRGNDAQRERLADALANAAELENITRGGRSRDR